MPDARKICLQGGFDPQSERARSVSAAASTRAAGAAGLYFLLLDEPLNHLDIEGAHFEAALTPSCGTAIAVSHDRAFLRSFAERVVEVRDGLVRLFLAATTTTSSAPGGDDLATAMKTTRRSARPPTWRRTWNS